MVPIVNIFLSIAFPLFVIMRFNQNKPLKRPYIFALASFFFCGLGNIQQIIVIKRRLFSGDIGGIEDTIGAVIIISLVMLVVTVVLNLVMLGICCEKD